MKMKRIAVYVRIPKCDEDKLQAICEEYRDTIAKHKGCQLVEIYSDVGMSGMDNDRPEYLRMLQAARNKEFDYIVTKHAGKLSRRISELHKIINELTQNGVSIYYEDKKVGML